MFLPGAVQEVKEVRDGRESEARVQEASSSSAGWWTKVPHPVSIPSVESVAVPPSP